MTKKHLIAAGTPNYLAISPQYSDEEVRAYVRDFYKWQEVTIERKDHIILVQPKTGADNGFLGTS